MTFLSSLRQDQKEAVGLLQVGTFLEYFDLMLYVHMAVVLNELFFPVSDAKTASLLAAFAFCSTYVLRPFGALIFGYIGDHMGRKTTVIITTMMMAISCIIMATLPTYAQIGITAAWLVTLCRVIQGLSSMGEIIGAEIYITEITKPPTSYPVVALIGCASRLGTMAALGVATLVTLYSFDWRNAFWVGAAIAVVGSVARTRLRETPEFVDMKRRLKKSLSPAQDNGGKRSTVLLNSENPIWKKRANWKMLLAYFLISSGPPACLYFSYIYCGLILKGMGYSGQYIIAQNFFVSIVEFAAIVTVALLSIKIHPLKIVRFRGSVLFLFFLIVPFLMYSAQSATSIFLIQLVSVCFTLTLVPAVPCVLRRLPIFRRFTYASVIYAVSRAFMHVIASFGLVFLTDSIGHWGLYFIMMPVTAGFLWGVIFFEKQENKSSQVDMPEVVPEVKAA